MNKRKIALLVSSVLVLAMLIAGLGLQKYVSLQIATRVEREIPNASGVSVSIPIAHLPRNFQNQIKSKSQRNLKVPEGMRIKSVALSSKGLSLNMTGTNVRLSRLREGIEVES